VPYREQPAQPPVRALPAPDREGRTKAAAEEQRRAAIEEQKRAAVEEQRRPAVEQQGQAAAEEQKRAEQQRGRGPKVQPDTGRRGKQPQKRKLILGPHGWEWVWVEEEDTGGN
jgi:hypothetical protein